MFLNLGEATPHRQHCKRDNLGKKSTKRARLRSTLWREPSLKQGEREVSARAGARIRLRQPPPPSAPAE
jgi:hypothetical protein